MAKTTSDLIMEHLLEWGVDACVGICGDQINGFSSRYGTPRTGCGSFMSVMRAHYHDMIGTHLIGSVVELDLDASTGDIVNQTTGN
jgi:hypothetical protein